MRRLFSVALIAAALGASATVARTASAAPPTRTVTAAQPGLLEVADSRVNDVYGSGIQKIIATPGNGVRRSISAYSPWGHIYCAWPKDVKQVAFTIETAKNEGGHHLGA
jgi:hypothetical protein